MTSTIMLLVGLLGGWFARKYFGPQITAKIDAKVTAVEAEVKSKL